MKRRIFAIALAALLMLALAVTAFAASGDTLVYRTASGKKYHTMTCSTLDGKDSIELTLQEAVDMGLTPCSKCKAPELDAAGTTTAAAAAGTAAAAATASKGFLSGVSPILTFVIGVLVGALGITYVRGRLIMASEEAEAAEAEEAEAEEEE